MTIRHLAIAGHIGVGKSSLTQLLSRRYKMHPFHEPNHENPFLKRFYADMKTWAFRSQVFFLVNKFNAHQSLLRASAAPMIQDRTIYEDAEIFAAELSQSGCMSEAEWVTYTKLYEEFTRRLPAPDLMIYLRAEVETLQDRIAKRGRREEQEIPEEYLHRLHGRYERWFSDYNRSRKLCVTVDEIDFVHKKEDQRQLIATIEAALSERFSPPASLPPPVPSGEWLRP